MKGPTFAEMAVLERMRINRKRDGLLARQQKIEDDLAALNRELLAIDAYERAKAGKTERAMLALPAPARPAPARPIRDNRGRPASRREPIMELLRGDPVGMTRREILTRLGLFDDNKNDPQRRPGKSVSNALYALMRENQIRLDDGKYMIVQ